MFLCEKGAEELCHGRKNGRVKNQNKFNSWTTSVHWFHAESKEKAKTTATFALGFYGFLYFLGVILLLLLFFRIISTLRSQYFPLAKDYKKKRKGFFFNKPFSLGCEKGFLLLKCCFFFRFPLKWPSLPLLYRFPIIFLRAITSMALFRLLYSLLNLERLVPVSQKSRNFSDDLILFVSSKRRCSGSRNFAVTLFFSLYKLWKD